MDILEVNCDYNLSKWLCIVANVCGYISNCIWLLVLLPQIVKNFKRKSTLGLSFIWASCNFYASLFNSFFVFSVNLPLFSKFGAVYMPILELLILAQFGKYSLIPLKRKLFISFVYLILTATIIIVECSFLSLSSHLIWISIVLWSVETYFQILVNMERKSVDGQSYVSLALTFVGKTTDFITQFILIMPQQYLYMTYFSSSFAYFNVLQWINYIPLYHIYKVAIRMILLGLLCVFAICLYVRTSIISIACIIVFIMSIAIGVYINKRPINSTALQVSE